MNIIRLYLYSDLGGTLTAWAIYGRCIKWLAEALKRELD